MFKDKFYILFLNIVFCLILLSQALAITIKDDLGETIIVPPYSQRIISLAPNITEILFALKIDKKIVAITNFCNYPPQTRNKEKIGGYVNPNLEKIVSLKPDVVFAAFGTPAIFLNNLKKLKIKVFATNPQTIQQTFVLIKNIGVITNTSSQAKKIITSMQNKLSAIKNKIKKSKQAKQKVLIIIWDNPLTTAGKNTLINDLIENAGGINIAHNFSLPYPTLNIEQVIKLNPDIIFLAGMGKDWKEKLSVIYKSKSWQVVKAVKNKKCFFLNPDIVFRAGPRLIFGLKQIAVNLYPKVFKK